MKLLYGYLEFKGVKNFAGDPPVGTAGNANVNYQERLESTVAASGVFLLDLLLEIQKLGVEFENSSWTDQLD